MTIWNIKVKNFHQAPSKYIIDYGLKFDAKMVETYPLFDLMGDLLKIRVYCKRLRACYKLPCLVYPYLSFDVLRERHE